MEVAQVPQDNNRTLGGHRKAVYARDGDGRLVAVASTGWEVEEIVTTQAIDALRDQAEAALERGRSGASAPLEYWMYARRMDLALLAQTTGIWRWRIRRHMKPHVFARLAPHLLERYARALGVPAETLRQLP